MEAALVNLNGYKNGGNSLGADLSAGDILSIGDLNGDHIITNADLQSLLNLLKSGGGSTSVPEPAALVLMLLATAAWLVPARQADNRSGG